MRRLGCCVVTLARKILGPGDFDEVRIAHAVLGGQSGLMMDVGAHHGGSLLPFLNDGWHVLAFEPDPSNRAILEQRTRNKTGISIDPRAISERDGESATFYTSTVSTGISTLAAFHTSHEPTTSVTTVRLDTYLAGLGDPVVTFLKVDTEGFDLPGRRRPSLWVGQKPQVVVCEFEDRKTLPLGYNHRDLANFLADKGYAVFVSEWKPVVEYGQHHDWMDVRRWPVELHDPSGWGNFIGVSPEMVNRVKRQVRIASVRLRSRRTIERLLRKGRVRR